MDIDRRVSTDGRARVILSMRNGLGRHRIARHHIITRLASRARGAGTEVVTGSEVVELDPAGAAVTARSEEHTSELQSLMRISYAVFCLKTHIGNSLDNILFNR